jgi:hypothetical protein
MMEAVMNSGRSPLALLGQRLPPRFTRRVVALMPGRPRAYDDAEWRGAIVVVERGQIELEGLDGSRHGFGCGAILWLDRLPLRAIHSCGPAPAVLVAIARR